LPDVAISVPMLGLLRRPAPSGTRSGKASSHLYLQLTAGKVQATTDMEAFDLTIEILLPQFGSEMTEGKIVRWLKAEGEAVTKGEILLEVETDKAVVEIQSPADGILGPILKSEENVAKVGEGLGSVLLLNEIASQIAPTPSPASSPSGVWNGKPGVSEPQSRADGRARISPLAKRLAEKLGVDIGSVVGSGPEGRIIESDILKAAQTASDDK